MIFKFNESDIIIAAQTHCVTRLYNIEATPLCLVGISWVYVRYIQIQGDEQWYLYNYNINNV